MALRPSADDEARHLLALYGSPSEVGKVLAIQFTVIQSRTQLVMTMATIILSVSGFSGPRIANSGLFAREAMIFGLCFVLLAVVFTLAGSLRINFLTQFMHPDPVERLSMMITYRNRKTAWYVWQLALVVGGLACFVGALISYLLHGQPVVLPVLGP